MKLLSLTIVSLLSLNTFAGASLDAKPAKPAKLPFTVGLGISGGTGCPAGTSQLEVDAKGIVRLLLPPLAISSSDTAAAFARKSCNIRVPVKVSKKYKLVIKEVLNIGEFNLDPDDSATFSQRVSFVGGQPKVSPDFKLEGNTRGPIAWKNMLPAQNLMESPCSTGRDVMITVDTNMMLLKNSGNQATNSELKLHYSQFQIHAVKCK